MAVSPWVESNLRHLGPPPAAVLDLACGRGRHALHLLALGYRVTAVDSDEQALEVLRQRAKACSERLTVVCSDLELSDEQWLPPCLRGQRFAAVLVINYLHRPLLREGRLLELLEPGGLLIYETWAAGNEAYATAKTAETLVDRTLRPNELLEVALPRCEVLGYLHGLQEGYEGARQCAKQMICAQLRNQSPATLARLLAGDKATSDADGAAPLPFVGVPEFGKRWLHCKGAAPVLPFGVEAFLAALAGYDPRAETRAPVLAQMRHCAAEGLALAKEEVPPVQGGGRLPGPRLLWSASMVKRVPAEGEAGGLRTEAVVDESAIRAFLDRAALASAEDLEARGEGWTFVANQLQGASQSLRDLQQRLLCATGLSGGLNGYLTPSGAIGKPPHVDDHDVIVVQQHGSKTWTLLDADARSTATRRTAAEVCLAQGDVLYLPQGVPHHAKAQAKGAPSLHFAVALHRQPLSWAAVLAALLTLRGRGLAAAAAVLPTSFVEELDGRRAALAAYGGRDHWLNQVLPAHLHAPLVAALDPEDLPKANGAGILQGLAESVSQAARSLAGLLRGGAVAVPGDSRGLAAQRALLQGAAMGDCQELEAIAGAPPDSLQSEAVGAFWACRERNVDQHYAHHGPYHPGPRAAGGGDGRSTVAPEGARWRRLPGHAVVLLRPGGVLRVNGYRLPKLSAEELGIARFALGAHTGAAGGLFGPSDLPTSCPAPEAEALLHKLVSSGALEQLG